MCVTVRPGTREGKRTTSPHFQLAARPTPTPSCLLLLCLDTAWIEICSAWPPPAHTEIRWTFVRLGWQMAPEALSSEAGLANRWTLLEWVPRLLSNSFFWAGLFTSSKRLDLSPHLGQNVQNGGGKLEILGRASPPCGAPCLNWDREGPNLPWDSQ